MRYASVFLSHAHEDKPFVRKVADRLVRKGIVVWEDVDQLRAGQVLRTTIKKAIENQTAIAVFFSKESLNSNWCDNELTQALQAESGQSDDEKWIIPVFLGDPLTLVLSSRLLKLDWLDLDGDGVQRFYISANAESDPDDIANIASRIAERVYELLGFSRAPEVGVVVDQRGVGRRVGDPPVPGNLSSADIPALVFRPDQLDRDDKQVLRGEEWEGFSQDVRGSLHTALGNLRSGRMVRIAGDGQTGLFYLLGRIFDRNTGVKLSCHHSHSDNVAPILNNSHNWLEADLLGDGNPKPSSLAVLKNAPRELQPGEDAPVVALLLFRASAPHYLREAVQHVQAEGAEAPPCVWLQPPGTLQAADARQMVADVLKLVRRLRNEHGTEEVRIYSDLPVNLMPLLAAQLTHKDIIEVVFMEYDYEKARGRRSPKELYAALNMAPEKRPVPEVERAPELPEPP
jgi:hypothetical protein